MKLAILDKDGTITTTASGAELVQHPEDQVLLPGVKEAVARLVNDGYTLVIASNQGGCAVQKCKASDFPVGAYYVNSDERLKITSKNQQNNGILQGIVLTTAKPRHNGKGYLFFDKDSEVKFQYKALEDAIAEMKYCASLITHKTGCSVFSSMAFCPDFEGKELWSPVRDSISGWQCISNSGYFPHPELVGKFRKPNPGMLAYFVARYHADQAETVMIGDRDSDCQAAQAAGIRFWHADDWRSGK